MCKEAKTLGLTCVLVSVFQQTISVVGADETLSLTWSVATAVLSWSWFWLLPCIWKRQNKSLPLISRRKEALPRVINTKGLDDSLVQNSSNDIAIRNLPSSSWWRFWGGTPKRTAVLNDKIQFQESKEFRSPATINRQERLDFWIHTWDVIKSPSIW